MNDQGDILKTRLAQLACEMDFGIEQVLEGIKSARELSHADAGDRGQAYRAALDDVGKLMRGAREAHERFGAWTKAASDQLKGQPRGITIEEHEVLDAARRVSPA
jgi:hypothetical protein